MPQRSNPTARARCLISSADSTLRELPTPNIPTSKQKLPTPSERLGVGSWTSDRRRELLRSGYQLTNHVWKDPAVPESDHLFRRIDPHGDGELDGRAIGGPGDDGHFAAMHQPLSAADQRVLLRAGQLQRGGAVAGLELQ